MKYIFIIVSLLLLIYLIKRRKIDFFFVGAICLIIYNIFCAVGVVYIASHEQVNRFYYWSKLLPQTYFIVISQLIIFAFAMYFFDRKSFKYESMCNSKSIMAEDYYKPLIIDEYEESAKDLIFKCCCAVAWIITLYNVVVKIGLDNMSNDKNLIWDNLGTFYITGNWLGMAAFTFFIRKRKRVLAIISCLPVLVHLFIGSRAYFVVLIIVALVVYGTQIENSLAEFWKLIIIGIILSIFILAYKLIYEEVKQGNFQNAINTLMDPDTYAFVGRLGEPRIVLANLNYIIEKKVYLGMGDFFDRLVACIPFLNDFIRVNDYTPVSQILQTQMNSSYGLASNIWGEFYSMGSYFLLYVMYFAWLKVLDWGNHCLKRKDWSSCFLVPVISYTAFYIHRMDFVKLIGNYKMDIMAGIIFIIIAVIITGYTKIHISIKKK